MALLHLNDVGTAAPIAHTLKPGLEKLLHLVTAQQVAGIDVQAYLTLSPHKTC